jgi:hypothetical protein
MYLTSVIRQMPFLKADRCQESVHFRNVQACDDRQGRMHEAVCVISRGCRQAASGSSGTNQLDPVSRLARGNNCPPFWRIVHHFNAFIVFLDVIRRPVSTYLKHRTYRSKSQKTASPSSVDYM